MDMTQTAATIEATLTQDGGTGNVEISLYRSIPAGICQPWGTVQMPETDADSQDGRPATPLATADARLAAAGYRRATDWQIRGTHQGLALIAEVVQED
jgi:hypothetical protein